MIHLLAEILPILLKASPVIASALGSPVAGIAMSLISYAFGTDPNEPRALVEKVMADVPHATSILQSLEAEHGNLIKSLLTNANGLASAEINIKLVWNQNTNSQG